MSSPYGDWAEETGGNNGSGDDWGNNNTSNDNFSNQGNRNNGGDNGYGERNSGGNNNNGSNYGGGYSGGGSNYGGSGGFNPNDIKIPGKYVPIAINIGKDMPQDKVELLNMMLTSISKSEFTARVGFRNQAKDIVKNFVDSGKDIKVEYVRPWKKFEVPPFANREDDWYPTLPVTKTLELLIPQLGSKDDKSRPFKINEGALICGRGAKQVARLLITYSPDGIVNHLNGGKESAYMQNVIRIAQMYGVTVINLGAPDARQKYGSFLTQFQDKG